MDAPSRNEPSPFDPAWPRWSRARFPPYRFVPGRSPHPRRDRGGHGYGAPEPRAIAVDPAAWATCELWLFGVDLYSHAYFWEAHEAFEALWNGAGRSGAQALFFQGLIQIAASELKRFMGAESSARALGERGLSRLREAPARYMGMDVASFVREVEARLAGELARAPLIVIEAEKGGALAR